MRSAEDTEVVLIKCCPNKQTHIKVSSTLSEVLTDVWEALFARI